MWSDWRPTGRILGRGETVGYPYRFIYPISVPTAAPGTTTDQAASCAFVAAAVGFARNVKDYGAKGDGVADDTSAINSAISSAAGGTVFFPVGTYLTSGIVGGSNGLRLIGAGRQSCVIINTGGAGNPLIAIPDGIRGYHVEGFFLKSTNGTSQGPAILIGTNFGEVEIKDVEIYAYGSQGGVQQTTGNGIHLTMINVRSNGGTNGFNFYNTGSVEINTINAISCYCNDADADGWKFSKVTQFNLFGCSSDNNGIRTSGSYGYLIAGVQGTLIGCTFENNAYSGSNGGGIHVVSGNAYNFFNCSSVNQGQPWNIAAGNNTMYGCRATTIPWGSGISLGGSAKVFAWFNSIFGMGSLSAWKLIVGTSVYCTEGTLGLNGSAPPSQASNPGTATGTDATVINNIVTILRNMGMCV